MTKILYQTKEVAPTDQIFRSRLEDIKPTIKKIYYRGNLSKNLLYATVAIVGSRSMTPYGEKITRQLVTYLVNRQVTIVSGFMYGVDAVAHQQALQDKGRTIAILPCGVDIVHPSYHKSLYKMILQQNGVFISEYPDGTTAKRWTYPQRNRIVAAVSDIVIIIEAGYKSGSLITANYARKFKRKLFAIPGNINSKTSKGCNQLIRERQAEMLTRFSQLDPYLTMKATTPMSLRSVFQGNSLSKSQKKVLKEIRKSPQTADTLQLLLHMDLNNLQKILINLEMRDLIYKKSNIYYVY